MTISKDWKILESRGVNKHFYFNENKGVWVSQRADIGNPAKNEQDSLTWKLNYAKNKIALLPAFGDSIGKDVSKAELALSNIYIGEAVKTVPDLLAALERIVNQAENGLNPGGNTYLQLNLIKALSQEAIAKAKGEA